MICPLARAGAAVGTGNLEGTRQPTKRGSDRMSSRGIFTTDLSRQGRSGQDPPHQRNALEERRIAWMRLAMLGTQAILKSLSEFEQCCASIA